MHGFGNKILLILILTLTGFATGYARDFVVVIDAGHGGHDSGCVGKKAREKDIVLDVAKQLARRITQEMKGVKAVLTRSDDKFIPLQERANIANRNNGDLFISIHINSVPLESAGRTRVSGAQVFTLGPDKSKNKLSVAMRENSVIELEEDYTQKYKGFDPSSTESYIIFELNQNAHMKQSVSFASIAQRHLVSDAGRLDKGVRQDGFWVLWATKMPAVLVELDFLCNPTQEEFLTSTKGKEKCVGALFNAIKEYREKNRVDTAKSTDIKNHSKNSDKQVNTKQAIAANVASAFSKP